MDAEPSSSKGVQLVVADIEAARAQLVERGVEVGEVQGFDWGSFVFFADPDGNAWSVHAGAASSVTTTASGPAVRY